MYLFVDEYFLWDFQNRCSEMTLTGKRNNLKKKCLLTLFTIPPSLPVDPHRSHGAGDHQAVSARAVM